MSRSPGIPAFFIRNILAKQTSVTLKCPFVPLSHIRFTMSPKIMYNTLEFCVFNGRDL